MKLAGPRRVLVRFGEERHALIPELALQVADVGEGGEVLGAGVPARIEREHVLLEHPLERPDDCVTVLENQPAL